ncbi:MAG: NTP transferase domain-containing protein [Mucilaginibacter sp.]
MISKGHNKHTALVRPVTGNFGRNEWAIVGGPCTTIKLLADAVIGSLSAKYKCAYADTSHNDDILSTSGRLASGAVLEYTDQLNFHQFNYSAQLNTIKFKQQFADADLVLVNGNHQQAKAQVVIVYNNKKASLQKRIEQLTNVQLILLAEPTDEIFDFVKEAIPHWQNIPVYSLDDRENIITFFEDKMQQAVPALNGLVLAGGKSVRMGHDKGLVNWHGKQQRYYMADMLKAHCKEVFISCRTEQKNEIDTAYNTLADTFIDLGPYGAILSAFRENPDKALLVIACDLPLMDNETLAYLIANRDPSAIATAFKSGFDDFPEPLITIWEPKSYPVLLAWLAQGYSCPRKVLINSDIGLLQAPNPDALTNVNTPEDLEKVKQVLH